jgi:hypothetical protein
MTFELPISRAAIARIIARKVAGISFGWREYSPVMAARVGAFANGTATRCVQLARLRPVTM